MNKRELESVAQALVKSGKGILAADESTGTITKRLASVDVITEGAEAFISGVILYDETIRQADRHGTPFPELLKAKGIIPGIKVDTGAKEMAGFPGERVTEGLDGLRDRLAEYREMGAGFAKWRAVINIGAGIPTSACIKANAHALARYAALCQEAGIVPVVEPEVMMTGDHTIRRCEEVTTLTLQCVFDELLDQRVLLEGMLLKPNMVLSGKGCSRQAGVQEVAEATLRCFLRVVPAAVPGVVFLSGGQNAVKATQHLNAMNAMDKYPWELSFSYGRALQAPALNAWRGEDENVPLAQRALFHRARCNGAARYGRYTAEMEEA